MAHLTFNEIIDFMSFEKIDNNTLQLASVVNTHISECKECFDLVSSFQLIYDEFNELGKTDDFVLVATERYQKHYKETAAKTKLIQK